MGAFGLRTHIWQNNMASMFLLAMFPVLLLLILYAFMLVFSTGENVTIGQSMAQAAAAIPAAVPFAVAGAGAWFGIAWLSNQAIINASVGSKSLSRQDAPDLYNMLENLSISRGMEMPKLRIVETEAMNAFATGLSERRSAITVTRGLLNALDRDELEAVLAHELTHVRNKDIRLLVIAMIFVGIISFVGEMAARGFLHGPINRAGSGKKAKDAIALVLIAAVILVVAYVLAILIRFAISRRREYLADAGAVELTRNPDAMISALRKISGGAGAMKAPDMVQEMFIHHPKTDFMDIFATHPPIEKRIAALKKFAGGREDPPPAPEAGAGPWGATSAAT